MACPSNHISEFIVPDLYVLINKSNGTNCKYVCKLYVGALVSEHQTNQSSLKIQENQKEIHEPNSTFDILTFTWNIGTGRRQGCWLYYGYFCQINSSNISRQRVRLNLLSYAD